eukprot:GFUD01001902.1.p1 GENE.GFUD01001902.1~~GFUD01001902.1.p1  ORF type:complete len:340 (-),score=25.62 GFUD01001902.1:122-1141(-)
MSQEEFLLKWNDHHASFFTIVEDLCRTEQLCDVTLACGGQVFETHKLILSVCSPYFRTLLNSRPDKHPIVYLKDVNPKHLEQLLSYMYRGEINVLQEDLGPLIETARGLQIKGLADAGDNNSRKEPKTNQNGLPSHPQTLNQPKRSRTSTPTPAPKIARIETSRPAPHPTQVLSPPSQNSYIEDDDQPIVEVDPTENSQIKQEMWMMSGSGRDDEESNEFEIPPEQYEQDMQAEDEQYIQAGNEGLTGQQFPQKTMHLNAIGNRNVSYNQESFVTAYYDVLIHGLTITKAAMKHQIPRKTLEYYVKGKATHDSYQKMGLPLPHELLQYEKPEQNIIETV